MVEQPGAETSLVTLFLSSLAELQPTLRETLQADDSLVTAVTTSAALLLVRLAATVPLQNADGAGRCVNAFEADDTDAAHQHREEERQEARDVVMSVLGRLSATQFATLSAVAALSARTDVHAGPLYRLTAALTRSSGPRRTGYARALCESLDTDVLVLLVCSALWLASKFWLAAIQRVSLNSMLMHMHDSFDAQPAVQQQTVEDVADLLAPPPDEMSACADVVGSALRLESSDLRGGSGTDWVPAVADDVESVEMLLLRCSEYTVPLALPPSPSVNGEGVLQP